MKHFLILYLFFLSAVSFAQTGFIGKRNELQFEGTNALMQGKYGLNYKFCFTNSFLLKTEWAYQTKKFIHNESNLFFSSDNVTDLTYTGFTFGASAIFGFYRFTNMPMPIGYYTGIGFTHTKGTASQTSKVEADYWSATPAHTEVRELKVNTTVIKVTYGRNFAVTEFLTIDASLDVGFSVYTYDQGLDLVVPYSNPILHREPDILKLYIMPNLCLGYIF